MYYEGDRSGYFLASHEILDREKGKKGKRGQNHYVRVT